MDTRAASTLLDTQREHALPGRELEPFRVRPRPSRDALLAAQFALAHRRDGDVDLTNATLPRREAWLADLREDPVRWREPQARAVDRPLREAWLTAIEKANEGEAYGVELEIERFAREGLERADRQLLYVALEDRFHTQVLSEVSSTFGRVLALRAPSPVMRLLIRSMNLLPESLRFSLVLCGEVGGVVLFQILEERCALFRDQPDVEARLRALVGEIASDEVGHVAYFAARVHPRLLAAARWMMPFVGTTLLMGIPEFARLGGGATRVLARMCRALPVPREMARLARP